MLDHKIEKRDTRLHIILRPPLHYGEGLMIMEMVRALKTLPKAIPWKFINHLCVGLV